MNLKNQPPVFVPSAYWSEIEKLSKAALMDIAWDFAMQACGEAEERPRQIMDELRKRMELIQMYRQRERGKAAS